MFTIPAAVCAAACTVIFGTVDWQDYYPSGYLKIGAERVRIEHFKEGCFGRGTAFCTQKDKAIKEIIGEKPVFCIVKNILHHGIIAGPCYIPSDSSLATIDIGKELQKRIKADPEKNR